MSMAKVDEKARRYLELVNERKECRECKDSANPCRSLINPSECASGAFDSDEIGPWTRWHGNLNAELMVVGQDWGDVGWFKREEGRPTNTSTTNTTLIELIGSAGFNIGLPRNTSGKGTLFFTNAVLCMKQGGASDPVRDKWFRNCGTRFLRPLIELVQPKVVVCLGGKAYDAVLRAFDKKPRKLREATESTEPDQLPGSVSVFAVYHCGGLGLAQRNLAAQHRDWSRIRSYLSLYAESGLVPLSR